MTEAKPQPTLSTRRLVMRPFTQQDAEVVQNLLQEKQIAGNTRTIEHPYPEGAAAEWIAKHQGLWAEGKSAVFASCLAARDGALAEGARGAGVGPLVGAVGLEILPSDENAELGYWIGKPYWGQGFATEAARRVLQFGFENLGLHRIHASHMTKNPASGRVLEKIGMRREGLLRGHMKKWGVFEDIVVFGLVRGDL